MKNETFVSAMKRKSVAELGAMILREVYGKEDEAKELEEAGRITVALIDRTCIITEGDLVDNSGSNENDEVSVETTDATELTFADSAVVEDTEPAHDWEADIRKAIKKGKGKKALKLIKEAKDNGTSGSVLKDLKKQAEAL
jgi:hypothetical protein